jgi:peptidoglycan/LPS O-acetylase OafA/YrhL
MKAERSPGLDLVRSIAILMVLVSHCGEIFGTWFGYHLPMAISKAGSFGVELFFVLSGFLIGRLLMDIIAQKPDFRGWLVFMTRRWMRTLPLYFLCVALMAVVWPPYFWEPGHAKLWHALPWFVTLTQNLAWPMAGQWFPVSWSLTVEEWFYLLFSALLMAGVAWTGRWWFWVTALLFLTIPPILRANLPDGTDWVETAEKVVVYRLDSIAFGTLIAWLEAARSPLLRRPNLLLACGAAIVAFVWADGLAAMLVSHDQLHEAVKFDAVSLGYALMLPAAAGWRSIGWFLAGPARAISRQSYCIYLIHLTLLELASYYRGLYNIPAIVCVILTLGATWVLSWLSYRWIERPILAHRPSQGPREVLA